MSKNNKDINIKENAKIVFHLTDILVFEIVFLFSLMFFYSNYFFYYSNGYIVFFIIYLALFLILGNLFDSFELGETTTTDLFLSHTLTVFFLNILMYFVLCLISLRIIPVLPIVFMDIIQVFLSALLLYLENNYIRSVYPPVRVLVIYGEEHYGLIEKIDNVRDLSIDVVKTIDATDVDFDKLEDLIKDVDGIVSLDVHHENKKKIFKACYERKMLVYDIPSITDMLLASSDILHMVDTPVLKVNKYGPSQAEKSVKRSIDILGSLVLIVLTGPIMLAVAAAIKIQDGGDVFYRQKRLTQDGKEFEIVKFRSMIMNAEKKTGVVLASKNDSRITPVGNFIRKTRFDELPQLFNILRGEMSFVGPRPERPEIYNEICKTFPEFRYRLVVKAGLTGYAQIYGKYNTSLRDKLLLDLYYIENYGIVQDIKLLLLTIKIVFNKDSTEGIKEGDKRI